MGFGTNKRLEFALLVGVPLEPRVQLLFLTKRQCCPLVEDDERVSVGKASIKQSHVMILSP